MRSVAIGQRIVFVDLKDDRQHRDAYVIGTEIDPEEGTFFWIFVPETKMVHVGVTHSLHERDGVEYLWEVDMTRHAKDVIEGAANGDTTIFYYSRDDNNREAMTKVLQMRMLLV